MAEDTEQKQEEVPQEEQVQKEEAPAPQKEKKQEKSSVDLRSEIESVLNDLYAAEEPVEEVKEEPAGPSKADFEKALTKITERVEGQLREDYESKLDSKFKELNERLDELSSTRSAPRSSQKNPFQGGSKEERDYSQKESFLKEYGLLR